MPPIALLPTFAPAPSHRTGPVIIVTAVLGYILGMLGDGGHAGSDADDLKQNVAR